MIKAIHKDSTIPHHIANFYEKETSFLQLVGFFRKIFNERVIKLDNDNIQFFLLESSKLDNIKTV